MSSKTVARRKAALNKKASEGPKRSTANVRTNPRINEAGLPLIPLAMRGLSAAGKFITAGSRPASQATIKKTTIGKLPGSTTKGINRATGSTRSAASKTPLRPARPTPKQLAVGKRSVAARKAARTRAAKAGAEGPKKSVAKKSSSGRSVSRNVKIGMGAAAGAGAVGSASVVASSKKAKNQAVKAPAGTVWTGTGFKKVKKK
jgi:hypothetical protein